MTQMPSLSIIKTSISFGRAASVEAAKDWRVPSLEPINGPMVAPMPKYLGYWAMGCYGAA